MYPAEYDHAFGFDLVFRYTVTGEDDTPALDYKRACAVDELASQEDCVLHTALTVVEGASSITRFQTPGWKAVDLSLPVPGVVDGFAFLGGEIPRRLGSAASLSYNAELRLKEP